MIESQVFYAPEYWASCLVNGDDSGLDAQEADQARAWAATLPGPIVGLESGDDGETLDSSFMWHHDATAAGVRGATCCGFVVHIRREGARRVSPGA